MVSTYWSEFRERVDALGSLPKFVVREVEEYLRCGILENGFIRVKRTDCRFEQLVALSCKRRGVCPSCLGRRMGDTAVWLTEHVIPTVQIRQWLYSLPWELRIRVGYDRDSSVSEAFTGMVTVIQRFENDIAVSIRSRGYGAEPKTPSL